MAKPKRKKPSSTYLSPGVYMEEVSTGSRPIEAVGTAVAAFMAFPRRHPVVALLAGLGLLGVIAVASRARN